MAPLSLLFVVLALASHGVLGAPHCSHKHKAGMTDFDSCVSKCKPKWGGHHHSMISPGPSASQPPNPMSYPVETPMSTSTPTTTVQPTPTSTPSNLEPSSPAPSNPAPSNSAPSNLAPSNPAPSNPAPSNPAPSNPAPSNPTGGSGSVSSADQQAYLNAHNTVRSQHGANPLTWSNELSSTAQAWANNCVFKHSGAGENLAAGTGDLSIASAIKMWTDEASSYNPNNPQASHFTQVVWKATTQVGCAVATCPGGSIFPASYGTAQYYVCHYSPPGNVVGEYSQNVQV